MDSTATGSSVSVAEFFRLWELGNESSVLLLSLESDAMDSPTVDNEFLGLMKLAAAALVKELLGLVNLGVATPEIEFLGLVISGDSECLEMASFFESSNIGSILIAGCSSLASSSSSSSSSW